MNYELNQLYIYTYNPKHINKHIYIYIYIYIYINIPLMSDRLARCTLNIKYF